MDIVVVKDEAEDGELLRVHPKEINAVRSERDQRVKFDRLFDPQRLKHPLFPVLCV